MAETRQKKAARLVIESYNERRVELGGGREAVADDVTVLSITPDAEDRKNWTAFLYMRRPNSMFWEVIYYSGRKFATVKSYIAMGQSVIQDPAPGPAE